MKKILNVWLNRFKRHRLYRIVSSFLKTSSKSQLHTNASDSENELMNVQEVAKHMSLAVSTIYGLVHNKLIPHFKTGKRLYFNKSVINNWILTSRVCTKEDINRRVDEYLSINK